MLLLLLSVPLLSTSSLLSSLPILSQQTPPPPSSDSGIDNMPHIGRGFYLPLASTYDLSLEGKSLFQDIPRKCFRNLPDHSKNRAQLYYFPTPASFYSYLGKTLGLGQYEILTHNFYHTLMQVSESVSPDLLVSGAGVELSRETSGFQFDPDCASDLPLDEELVRDFKNLPRDIINPALPSNWIQYDVFIKKYGTHFVKSAYFGNKILNFVFAKTSSNVSLRQLQASACMKVQNANLTFCSDVTQEEYNLAALLHTSEFWEIRGGSDVTRTALTTGDVTAKAILQFMQSTTDKSEDVRFTLEPVTVLLKKRFFGTEHFSRALNLLQYYEGFVSQGCFKDSVNGIPTQRFALVSAQNGLPEYQCQLAATGCRNNNDCHINPRSFWTNCYCYGPSCITSAQLTDAQYGTSVTRAARTSHRGSPFEGENMSCHYHTGPWCGCDTTANNKWVKMWPTAMSDLPRDLAMYRTLYKTGGVFASSGMEICLNLPTLIASILVNLLFK